MTEFKGVWAFSEKSELMLELLGKGRELAEKLETELTAVLLGADIERKAEELIKHGAHKVFAVNNPLLKEFHVDSYLSALANLAAHYKPEIILLGCTKLGKELAARLAMKLETGCIPDCIELKIDENRQVLMKRLVYGGNAVATLVCRTKPVIVSVPQRVFEKPQAKEERTGQIVRLEVKIEEPKTQIVEVKPVEAEKLAIEEAKVVVGGGRGVNRKEDFKILEELANTLGGQIANSRPLAEDRKWFSEWIGLSGRKIKPLLYIGCGVSGMIQHVAGIRDSKVIVAINKDPEAPIFEVADYIVVGDLYQIVPALTEAFRKLLKTS